MIAFTPELIWVILVAIVISTVSAVVIWRHTRTTTYACTREDCRRCQTVRFRREPRVGTRVGFRIGEDRENLWQVADVHRVDATGRVELVETSTGPFGTQRRTFGWMHVDELRWFPWNAPVGVYVDTVDADDDGENEGAHA